MISGRMIPFWVKILALAFLLLASTLSRAEVAIPLLKSHVTDLTATMARTQANFLIVSFSTDWRFTPARSKEIVAALLANGRNVSYAESDLNFGHDSFLMADPHYHGVVDAYLRNIKL